MNGDPLEEALERHFGFREFRDGQRAPVEAVLAGRDAVVVMPTGSGKSLCYQLAAAVMPGTALVVSPLIALMQDQVAQLERRGIPAACLNSSVSPAEMAARLELMQAGRYKLVYIAPERFRNERFRRAAARTDLSLLAVDEAHCISQWGHDFRPDYLDIRDALEGFADLPVMAVTATATPDVRDDIVRQLRLGAAPRRPPYVQVQGFGRGNLHLSVAAVRGAEEKFRRLEALVRSQRRGIVYVATRCHAEDVFLRLASAGRRLGESRPLMYHAGMDDGDRRRVYEAFVMAKYPVVVATNAFGMGVDRADLRFVAHWDVPGSVEAYYQEVGRAGRDGLPSRCELYFSWADVRLQEYFIEGANPSWTVARGVLAALSRPGGMGDPELLGKSLGANGIAVGTALNVLARHGAVRLEPGTGRDSPPRAVLAGKPDEAALEAVFGARREKEARDRRRLRAMVGFCDAPGCRHRYILNYFGEETRADVCGGCDRCGERSAPPPLDEAQWVAVQKALSCVGRLKGRQPAAVAADVLLGERGPAVARDGLDRVSTWGLLAGFGRARLLALLETLVRSGCVAERADGTGWLSLTPKGVRVARREEEDFTLRWPAPEGRTAGMWRSGRRTPAPAKAYAPSEPLDADARRRAAALRRWRKDAAEERDVAAFRIMSNKTLEAVAREEPRTLAHLSHIVPGAVLDEYGQDILDVLSDV